MLDLLGLIEGATTIKDALAFIWESIKNCQELSNQAELNSVDLDDSIRNELQRVGDSVTKEALDRYIAEQLAPFKPNHPTVFSNQFRESFATKFIDNHQYTRPYEKKVREVIDISLSRLEELLYKNLSYADRGVLRLLLDNLYTSRETHRVALETNDIVRSVQAGIKDVKDSLDGINGFLRNPSESIAEHDNTNSIRLMGATEAYAKEYENPLFHSLDTPDMCLRNLFVPPTFDVQYYSSKKSIDDPIDTPTVFNPYCDKQLFNEYLVKLISVFDESQDKFKFIFFEGKHGCGKSGLAAYMCYHYLHDCERFMGGFFKSRPLIAIRMSKLSKYLPKKMIRKRTLCEAILDYLHLTAKELKELNAILLLDGYDELYSSFQLEDDVLKGMEGYGWRIIITCRFGIVNWESDASYISVYNSIRCKIHNLYKSQRAFWLKQYENICGPLSDGLRASIENEYPDTVANAKADPGLASTPLGLYMIATSNLNIDRLDINVRWNVYNKLFSTVDSRISSFCKEFAYNQFSKPKNSLSIIKKSPIAVQLDEMIGRSFALCGFWDYNEKRGCVDFYSEEIRDYFICEKIFDELNKCCNEGSNQIQKAKDLKAYMCSNLGYFKLNSRIMAYVRCHLISTSLSGRPDACLLSEYYAVNDGGNPCLPILFGNLLIDDVLPLSILSTVICNVFHFYQALYDVISIGKRRDIYWWKDINEVNEHGFFRLLAKDLLPDISDNGHQEDAVSHAMDNCSNFKYVDLNHADLSKKNLARVDLSNAILEHTDLSGADLHGAILEGANLQNADLRNANLSMSNLRGADFLGANLAGCDLRTALNIEYALNLPSEYV